MCSAYWNLIATWTCPKCGHENADSNLQTHWMGDSGSCSNRYRLGEPVAELEGIASAVLNGKNDDFIASCDDCHEFIDLGGRIENGTVVEVRPVRWQEEPGRREGLAWVRPIFAYASGVEPY
jgi:hypothetical protein